MTTYGMPYQGSKNACAKKIIDLLPSAEVFVDVFAGGCAVTHAAMESGKYKRIIANDITDSAIIFKRACQGFFKDEKRWISREDFYRLKDTDAYARLCFSFGNNQIDYFCGRDREAEAKANFEAARAGARIDGGLQALQALRRLQRLQRLQPLSAMLEVRQGDYKTLDIPAGAVVYCDPPYRGRAGYCGASFDSEAFYDWARGKGYFISEYDAPFTEIASFSRRSTFSATHNTLNVTERLYIS